MMRTPYPPELTPLTPLTMEKILGMKVGQIGAILGHSANDGK